MITAIIFTILTILLPFREQDRQEEEQPEEQPEPDSLNKLERLIECLYKMDYGTPGYAVLEREVQRLAEIYYG